MIHIAANPTSPQDDWEPRCKVFKLSPHMHRNDLAESAEAAEEMRNITGQLVCGDCLNESKRGEL